VIADQSGNPFILSQSSGKVLYAEHGTGEWDPAEMFPDINTTAACLAQLGAVVVSAGEAFTDDRSVITPEYHEMSVDGLEDLLGSSSAVDDILIRLGWA
jgi:hypothetical protein